ncbi:MAG: AI-2E family transporter [Candidatus Cyclobacteriaceae bacterium M3_2C_046]
MNTRTIINIIFLIIGLVIFGFLVWYFSNIFIYLIISMVIATILKPLTNYIGQIHFFRLQLPRALAVILSFLVLIVILSLFIVLFIPLVNEQIQVLTNIDYANLLQSATAPLNQLENFLINNNLTIKEQGSLVANLQDYLSSLIEPLNITSLINEIISLAGSFFIGLIAVVFITFFLLYEKGIFRKHLISLIPNNYFEVSIAAIYKIEKLLSNYLIGLLFQMFSIFSIVYIGLTILGIKYSLAIGVFAAFANLIPYLGPVLGASFGLFVGLSITPGLENTNDYIFLTAKIVSVFAVVQLTDNLFLQPLIFSKSVKAHPLEIFIIIFVGATLAGIPGMIAAIPAYTVIRVSFLELYNGYKEYNIFKIN